MEPNVKCTKPHCNCVEAEEQRIGGPVKSYPCLAAAGQKNSLGDLKALEKRVEAFCQTHVSGSLPPDTDVEKWFAGERVDDAKFWADAPFRDNGDVVGIVIDALKHFMGGNDR